ncbi:zinc-dependent metalloprotease [Leucobacter sp. CSA1]|uniref:Zinc-dependent metalloprotease n=1 Tax=Leucobacter chromiisoli TaxID=2796471 RepID=A0A934Q9Y5_9MICO|nr:zinc-dependent metalloprotease [Leucobacter chromiisoli]MBK0419242.1 zinc-dependent metalloprotease [Leucobacter chromiisoli]
MSADEHDDAGTPEDGGRRPDDDMEELQRILREMLAGGSAAEEAGFDPSQFAAAAGLPVDPAALQGLFSTLRGAMQQPGRGIDWSATRRTAIEVAGDGGGAGDPAPAMRAFPVAALWLDEVTDIGASADAPRTLSRIEWVQQSVDTWIGFAEPVAESITDALMEALTHQMPEELSGALQGAGPMLRSVGGALFAVQLGSIIGKLSGEVVSAGDIGVPLMTGPGREGGALLPTGVAAFAEGLDQDAEAVTLYLAVRELAHARLFRHTKWLRLHLVTAITDYARGIRIDTDRIEEMAREIDPQNPEQIQELLAGGALIPPKTPEQEAAHARLETMLALIEGWVDVVTADAVTRLPGGEAIAEMVRRRRATGGPAERAFSTLVGLELRPRRLREAAALWRLVAERGDRGVRDGLWAHPDLLPTTEELDHPARLLERLGLAGGTPEPEEEVDDFDRELSRLLDGELPPHEASEDGSGEGGEPRDPEGPRS